LTRGRDDDRTRLIADTELVLDPDQFYILASKEAVHVPPTHAAEMVPFNPLVGEFRVHYAGFFDPGFGHAAAGGTGAKAVLEVRSHKVPFILEDFAGNPEYFQADRLHPNEQAQQLMLDRVWSGLKPLLHR